MSTDEPIPSAINPEVHAKVQDAINNKQAGKLTATSVLTDDMLIKKGIQELVQQIKLYTASLTQIGKKNPQFTPTLMRIIEYTESLGGMALALQEDIEKGTKTVADQMRKASTPEVKEEKLPADNHLQIYT